MGSRVNERGISMGRVIGFDIQLIMDLIIQIANTAILIAIGLILIRLGWLGIKALKIYIKKNS